MMEKIDVLGVKIDTLHQDDLIAEICNVSENNNRSMIAHVNIRALNLSNHHDWLRTFFNSCDRVYCDGMGIALGAFLLGERVPQRYTLADWIWPLVENGFDRGLKFFLLGNPPGVAQRAARVLSDKFPGLKIEAQHGFFNMKSGEIENEVILEQINRAGANILLVGFGMPIQETWLMENRSRLNVNVAITCGALFEYISGDLKRGPKWMTDHYLEWMARIYISPRRYFARYLVDVPKFLYLVLIQRLQREVNIHNAF